MIVGAYNRTWDVCEVDQLDHVLAMRDSVGGAILWLVHDQAEYPAMSIRISGEIGDVHFFPHDEHPGFRCLGGDDLPGGEMTTLVFEGADPGSGEMTPNEFVVPFETVRAVARDFFLTGRMSTAVSWFEL